MSSVTVEAPPPSTSSPSIEWLIWAAATGGALVFVLVLAVNVPYWDEWELVPMVTGNQPITPAFLWSLHNEHRLPLPRLVYLGLFVLFRDFRAGAVFSVLSLSAASALLVAAARRGRGAGAWTDGFFALVLLNAGQAENMLWSFQIAFVLTTTLVAVSLAVVAGLRGTPSRAQAIGIAGPIVLTLLCGAPGAPLAGVAGAWLFGWAARGSRVETRPVEGDSPPASRAVLAGLGFTCWGMVALYLYRYHGNPGHPSAAGVGPALRGATEFLSIALGPAAGWLWPWSAAVVLSLAIATAVAVACWWWRSRRDRMAAEGLLATLAALVALATAIGWGRSGFGPSAAMANRYTTLAAPIMLWAYLAWCRLPWTRLSRVIQVACFLGALALSPGNLAAGLEAAYDRRIGLQALAKEVQRGVPLAVVAARHVGDVYPDPVLLRERLVMLRRLRLGPFSPEEAAARFRRRFPFLKEPLVEAHEGAMSIRADRVGGRPVVVVHANGDLVFDVHPGLHRVTGFFGLLPTFNGAAARPGLQLYDGTYYQAVFAPDEGERVVLFSALLDPLHNSGDRGLRPFQLPLPDGGGRLILSTRFGPPGATKANGWGDGGFWADVEFR